MALLEALTRHCGDRLQPMPGEAGLHLAARLTEPLKAKALAANAADHGVSLLSLDYFATQRPAPNGLALGYGMIQTEHIDEAIRRIARAMSHKP